ncbi:DUF1996 domain-containing protein [Dactylosporangium matsuzakiense]|uniref:CBM6 domain-containing protein n=1 Tax=Dactylosporangium matsuzakiense TaxID=53360 RepID=A0A9W6KG19_9ACTN|nr:DUF1996 domain-containing protein [Dactylosporangium matsuzakiense]UWZ44445.1 DUF1996 domain-containing protein [Dactylosporangium matsuzakiense]GLK99389.1 hypothetical protein GCM10017581_011300 [Dactylosporangium matsuzakiense]
MPTARNPYLVPPRRQPKRRRTLLALLAVPVAGALAFTVVLTATAGAEQIDTAGVVQAEAWSAQSGTRTENTGDTGGGRNVGWLASGDWMRYDDVDLGAAGSLTASVRVAAASRAGGTVELRAGAQDGELLAAIPVGYTGGWQNWTTKAAVSTTELTGLQTVFLVLKSAQPADFININWLQFKRTPTATIPGSPTQEPPSSPASPSSPGGAPDGGWPAVDPAAQQADTAAFFARRPAPVTNNPVKVPEFHATCTVSHHAADDPIVLPGLAGASHDHTFLGNRSTSATSTADSLLAAGTTCTPAQDHSAYWIPTLYQNGKVVDPKEVTVYYGSRLKDPSRTQPFPFGLRMVTGDAKNQSDTPDKQGNHFWCAGAGGEVGRTADGQYPVCAKTAGLVRQVTFPDCWDGVHLDSPDHRAHMANGDSTGACPASHPVPIPSVSFVIGYPLNTDTSGITLSSGNGFSMHADFFNAWEPDALAQRVRDCLDQGYKCNAQGTF